MPRQELGGRKYRLAKTLWPRLDFPRVSLISFPKVERHSISLDRLSKGPCGIFGASRNAGSGSRSMPEGISIEIRQTARLHEKRSDCSARGSLNVSRAHLNPITEVCVENIRPPASSVYNAISRRDSSRRETNKPRANSRR